MEPQVKESLDALQNLFNDVLIQTGKALRAQHREAQGQVVAEPPLKFPETRSLFSQALDNLETEIVQAKSVFQRDITRLQTDTTQTVTQPEPVQPQTKSPLLIDAESSPPAIKQDVDMSNQNVNNKAVAPFPDMGMDSIEPKTEEIKDEPKQQSESQAKFEAPPVAPMSAENQLEWTVSNPGEAKPEKTEEPTMGEPTPADSAAFTNMEFTLVPTDSGPQGSNNGQSQGNDGSTGPNALDGINFGDFMPPNEPANNNRQPAFDINTVTQGGNEANNATETSALDDFDFSTTGPAPDMTWDGDGLDFDFNTEDNTFNDLMDSHEANYDGGQSNGYSIEGQNDTFHADFLDMESSNGF
ncbi:uncharacterized protein J7T54_002813 [Emericellopsis cladophorae]|uniref:Uncharacterized protein n=1 Tax=Emericellopsis cladophorae TaxID=2686198 RepID=A0A9P9XXI7_9HYPO|nr:uncharacterized protein J7T54_002813 [Emericellopsis cladophorae]KAI6779545.1 hypothetical protein J7T54_002813 [Emericellopsis cladophorae]